MLERYNRELREHPTGSRGNRDTGDMRGAWWGVVNDAYDLATVMAPRLLYSRLNDLGVDFSILYPTLGLALPTIHDDEVRRIACRALNTMNAEICGQFRDRIAPAAAIPMHTPDEAVAELEYAARLGLKVAMIPPGVARPIPALEREHPGAFPNAAYFDCYGLDSFFDYDPVWRKFVELKIAVTSHGGVGLRYLPLGRRSPTNYMFNHIGAHAYQQGELCRSIVMGGVATRFPRAGVWISRVRRGMGLRPAPFARRALGETQCRRPGELRSVAARPPAAASTARRIRRSRIRREEFRARRAGLRRRPRASRSRGGSRRMGADRRSRRARLRANLRQLLFRMRGRRPERPSRARLARQSDAGAAAADFLFRHRPLGRAGYLDGAARESSAGRQGALERRGLSRLRFHVSGAASSES